jgi:carboxymethylenebutenolidase
MPETALELPRPPGQALDRRSFIASTVGASFAAAVQPVGAKTITTPAQGLTAGTVTIASGGFAMPVYRALPAGGSGLPVVLVVSEIFGVHAHIADVARRLAHLGYLAIAPELFARHGDAKAYTEIPKLFEEVVSKAPDAQVMADLDACVAWAGANGGDLARLGVTGFCWGGRITWLYAAHSRAVKAGVAWYGRLAGATTPLQPRHPVDIAAQLACPVLGLYGAADEGIPVDTVDKMKVALSAGSGAARRSEIVVYPDTPHAFHADYRPNYRKQAADDGWKRCLAWFADHGVV